MIFDFNGTLVDDEELIAEICCELLSQFGIDFGVSDFPPLSGLSDAGFIRTVFAREGRSVNEEVINRFARMRVRLYMERVADLPIAPNVVEFVAYTADRVPMAIASGAFREEIEDVLHRHHLRDFFPVIVAAEDVREGKPNAECYVKALRRLREAQAQSLTADRVLAIEDATAGVIAAQSAGMQVLAIKGKAYDPAQVLADHVVERLDRTVARRLVRANR